MAGSGAVAALDGEREGDRYLIREDILQMIVILPTQVEDIGCAVSKEDMRRVGEQ